jgi:DNA-binding CsgD family transcriptional regulator
VLISLWEFVLLDLWGKGATPAVARYGLAGALKMTNLKLPTPRELYVLRMVAEKGSAQEAASALGLSECTVEAHLANIRRKTGIRSIATLVLFFSEWGMLDPLNPGV